MLCRHGALFCGFDPIYRDTADRKDKITLLSQKFSHSPLYHFFYQLQPFFRQIISGMFLETKGKQVTQAFFMLCGQHFFCHSNIVVVNAREKRICIGLQCLFRRKIVGARKVEQRITMVKQGSRSNNLIGLVIHQKAKVSKMPIRVENQGIQNRSRAVQVK